MAAPAFSELYIACRNGDRAAVRRLLPTTPLRALDSVEPDGYTCLHAAVALDQEDIARLLLQHGASRRVRDRRGRTPLELARRDATARLFRRTEEETQKRYTSNPVKQPEWQFEDDHAETFSRATNFGCIKDRGIKKTVKKLEKEHALIEDGDPQTEVVRTYFKAALQYKDPIYFLQAYTLESQFYKRLNREMATGNKRQVFKKLCGTWTGYYTGMIARNPAFERFRYSGQTYRGMQITRADFAQYKVGVALSNKSFQSTSKSWKIAKGFALPSQPKPGTLPVVLVFTIKDRRSALNISEISEYPHEEEVLLVPGTLFMVANINTDDVPYEVDVEQLEWTNEF